MSIKSPAARHQRFLAAGFFPPEMPSCFYSEQLALQRGFLLRSFTSATSARSGIPGYYRYISEKANFNFTRFRREDRRHAYINPISFFSLSKVLSDNYVHLRSLNRKSRLSVAPSIFDWEGERTLIRPGFASRDTQNAKLNARFELLAEADINAFYHSIYTHSVAWAIHGKAYAKRNRSFTEIGNVIDLLIRNSQDGQTIGLPVGPDTSRLIAEIVGTAIDRTIQKSLSKYLRTNASRDRNAMRFVDDYTFGCGSLTDGERVIASVRKAANE